MMKLLKDSLKQLKWFEWVLWMTSLVVVALSYILSGSSDVLTVSTSLVGVSALIFISKGLVLGQVLTVIFSLAYGVIAFFFRYYGEVISYLCMSTPIAVMSIISWVKHPYQDSQEVEVSSLSWKDRGLMIFWAGVVTFSIYFILKALGNANLIWSTVSITTSFVASYLTWKRSAWYAFAFCFNDVVLIILWVAAAMEDISCAPMIACFTMFLLNDLYGFFYWLRMRARQGFKA